MTPTISNIALNSVASVVPTDPQLDPRARRYGYGAGSFNPQVDARLSGMQTGQVPQHVLVAFETFSYPDDNPSLETGVDRIIYREQTAKEAIEYVRQQFVIPGFYDKGFREIEFLRGRKDIETLGALFSAVHPSFAEVGHECPFELDQCVSCRVAILGSSELEERILKASARNNSPKFASEIVQLRTILLDANQSLLTHFTESWRDIARDYEEGKAGRVGIRTLSDGHHHIRRNLHEIEPEYRNAQAAAAFGEAQSEGLLKGLEKQGEMFANALAQIGGNNNSDQLAQILLQMQQSQAAQTEMMLKMFEKQNEQQQTVAEVKPPITPAPKGK